MHPHTVCFHTVTYITHFNTYPGSRAGLQGCQGDAQLSCNESIIPVFWESTVGAVEFPPLAVLLEPSVLVEIGLPNGCQMDELFLAVNFHEIFIFYLICLLCSLPFL